MMELKACILKRAEQYAQSCDESALKSHDIRMKSPVLFVLFGSRAQEGLTKLKKAMSDSVLNAEGAVYFQIGGKQIEEDKQVIYMPLPDTKGEAADERKQLGELAEDEAFLKLLGEKAAYVKQRIMQQSRVFSYWQQMNIATVTMASDKENVLLQDVMILLKNKLEQDFKQVFMDLFILLQETTGDVSPLNKAMVMSFFKEVELYQKADFCYEKETEVLEDDLRLKVTHEGELFDLVYVLSDKKETGQKIETAQDDHFETIAAVNLLKNKESHAMELEEAREQFNYNVFFTNIREQAESRCVSGRLAKVKKPGVGIYLAVCYHLFKAYKKELSIEHLEESQSLLEAAGLGEEAIRRLVEECLPEEDSLSQLHSLISTHTSFAAIKSGSFREAERALYGDSAAQFFASNYEKAGERRLADKVGCRSFKEKLIKEIVNEPAFGPFAIKTLLSEKQTAETESQREKYQISGHQQQAAMEEAYEKTVGERIGGRLALWDKKYLHEVKDYLIQEIYGRKYKVLSERLKEQAIEQIQGSIESLYEELKGQLHKMDEIETELQELMDETQRYEENYLVQNVDSYYESVVNKKLAQLQETRGKYWLHEDKMMGKVSVVLKEDEKTILTKLFNIAEKFILSDSSLANASFEEELLARANMCIDYEDKQVAAKSQLYDLLYQSLEENSKPCVHLDTTVSPHRYIEKYFFGDRQSEFIDYAYKRDQSTRSYKIGTVSDERKSVIEKLQLMGGFKLQDLVFYEPALRYYAAYQEKGYAFHTDEVQKKLELIKTDSRQ